MGGCSLTVVAKGCRFVSMALSALRGGDLNKFRIFLGNNYIDRHNSDDYIPVIVQAIHRTNDYRIYRRSMDCIHL